MSLFLNNPYKSQAGTPPLHKLSCDVSVSDWKLLKQLIPEQGVADIFLSQLFFGLVQEIKKQNIPIPSNADQFTSVKKQLSSIVRRRANSPTP